MDAQSRNLRRLRSRLDSCLVSDGSSARTAVAAVGSEAAWCLNPHLPRKHRTVAQPVARIARQLAVLDERRRRGLPTGHTEEALRALRVELGLAYAREAVGVAELRHRMAAQAE